MHQIFLPFYLVGQDFFYIIANVKHTVPLSPGP